MIRKIGIGPASPNDMAVPLCPVCFEYMEVTADGECSECSTNLRIRLAFVAPETLGLSARPRQAPLSGPSREHLVARRDVDGAVAVLDASHLPCQECGWPVGLAEGVCFRCGQAA